MSRSAGLGALVAIAAADFDLELTLNSGQVFHWQRKGAGWIGAIGSTPIYVEQQNQNLLVPAGNESLVRHYFALDHPLDTIAQSFPTDPMMARAASRCRGMRIIRQPAWECLATFITSSMKQVTHIAQMSHAIRRRFGTPVDEEIRSYPDPARLAGASEEELRACALGYRAKNLLRTAAMIARGDVALETIALLDDEDARAELLRLPGVGEKVANCVLLFGFERLRAFPIDVLIERVLRDTYFRRKRKVTLERLQEFSRTYFGEFGGYAQQYLFHHARQSARQRGRTRAGRPRKAAARGS